MNIHAALDRFLLQLRANGRSPLTIAQRRRHIVALANWLGPDANVDDVGHEDIAAFLASPVARQRPDGGMRKAATVNVHRTSLREFFGFLHQGGDIPENPTRLVRRAVCGPPPPRSFSNEEKVRFLAALEEHGCERDRVLFQVMLGCGLRVGSAVGLDVQDVDLDRGVLHLRAAKGDREEEAVVPRAVGDLLRDFIGERTMGPLFVSRGGRRVSVRVLAVSGAVVAAGASSGHSGMVSVVARAATSAAFCLGLLRVVAFLAGFACFGVCSVASVLGFCLVLIVRLLSGRPTIGARVTWSLVSAET